VFLPKIYSSIRLRSLILRFIWLRFFNYARFYFFISKFFNSFFFFGCNIVWYFCFFFVII